MLLCIGEEGPKLGGRREVKQRRKYMDAVRPLELRIFDSTRKS